MKKTFEKSVSTVVQETKNNKTLHQLIIKVNLLFLFNIREKYLYFQPKSVETKNRSRL